MTDLKPPFWVKMHDPSRTFYDVATGLYIAQDQKKEVHILSQFIKNALHAGGLVPCDPPEQEETQEEETQGTSTQEGTEEEETAPEGMEDPTDTTGEQQDAPNPGSEEQEEEEQGGEEEEEEEQEEPAKELGLKDLLKLSKKSKKH